MSVTVCTDDEYVSRSATINNEVVTLAVTDRPKSVKMLVAGEL